MRVGLGVSVVACYVSMAVGMTLYVAGEGVVIGLVGVLMLGVLSHLATAVTVRN